TPSLGPSRPVPLSFAVSLRWFRDSAPPPSFPPKVPRYGAPLPSLGSHRAWFPQLLGTTETLRLPATHLLGLRCLRPRIPLSACLFAPMPGQAQPDTARWSRRPHHSDFWAEMTGSPRFLE